MSIASSTEFCMDSVGVGGLLLRALILGYEMMWWHDLSERELVGMVSARETSMPDRAVMVLTSLSGKPYRSRSGQVEGTGCGLKGPLSVSPCNPHHQ